MSKFTIENGVNVKSNITGFKGMVVSRSEHLNGCNRYWVQPKVDKNGKQPEGLWFDEGEIIVTSKPKLKAKNQDRGGFSSKVK